MVLAGIGLVFLLIQLYRPEKNLGEINTTADLMQVTQVSDTLARVLLNSCYDCHSNETRWPWYSKVAPISWRVSISAMQARGTMVPTTSRRG